MSKKLSLLMVGAFLGPLLLVNPVPAATTTTVVAKKGSATTKPAKGKAKTPPTTATKAVTIADVGGKAASAILRVAVSDVFRAVGAKGSFAIAKDGVGLAAGDRLKTNDNGRGTVNFSDGSLLRVAGTAEVTVTDVNVKTNSRKVNVNLSQGDVYAKVAKATGSQSEWTVNTPSGTASVRGTAFSVSCEPTICTVAVAEGVVEVTNPSGTVSVAAGNQTTMAVGVAPTAPAALDATADSVGGQWLLCNAQRDQIAATIAGETPTACNAVVGPVVLPLPAPGASNSAAPSSVASASTSAASTVAPTTGGPTTLAQLPSRPSVYTGSGGLTATILEQPYKCNGTQRNFVSYTGLVPGPINWTWTSTNGGPASSGSSVQGASSTGFSPWTCFPNLRGVVTTFVMTNGGNSVTFDLVMGNELGQ